DAGPAERATNANRVGRSESRNDAGEPRLVADRARRFRHATHRYGRVAQDTEPGPHGDGYQAKPGRRSAKPHDADADQSVPDVGRVVAAERRDGRDRARA